MPFVPFSPKLQPETFHQWDIYDPPRPADIPDRQPDISHWPDVRPMSSALNMPGLFIFPGGEVETADIAGVTPTIDGIPLDDSPKPHLTIPATGTQYVEAQITGTHALTGTGFARDLTSPEVVLVVVTTKAGPSARKNIASGGTFKIWLAKFVDGVKTAQNGYGPITVNFYDDGTNSGKLNAEVICAGGVSAS